MTCSNPSSLLELPPDAPKLKVTDPEVGTRIRSEWSAMSKEEQHIATEETFVKMSEDRETKATGRVNTSISAFHDARVTLQKIEDMVSSAYSATMYPTYDLCMYVLTRIVLL